MTIDISQSCHYVGDCRELLKQLPDNSVHALVSSPPFWGLRDYGTKGEIGQEETHLDYVRAVVNVFTEARRVVRPDGTLWLNLGDARAGSYGAQSRPGYTDNNKSSLTGGSMMSKRQIASHPRRTGTGSLKRTPGAKRKELLGLPWRIAFGLSDAGWHLRNDIIWAKTNAMPSPVDDRCVDAHEYIFMLSKSERNYFDRDAIAEPCVSTKAAGNGFKRKNRIGVSNPDGSPRGNDEPWDDVGGTRSPRTLWIIPTHGERGIDHPAMMTFEVAERCILAGVPPGGRRPRSVRWKRHDARCSREARTPLDRLRYQPSVRSVAEAAHRAADAWRHLMTRALIIEAQAPADHPSEIRYRFVCPTCTPKVEGAWHESLSDAERSAQRHNRVRHAVEASA